MVRKIPNIILACLVLLWAMGCNTEMSGVRTVITELARQDLSFSVLTVNLHCLKRHTAANTLLGVNDTVGWRLGWQTQKQCPI